MLATTASAVAITVVVHATYLDVAYRAPEGHVVVETAGGLVALLVGFIVGGRFLQSGRLSDLILACALAVLGFTNLLFGVLPAAAGEGFGSWATWAPVGGRLAGALGFAAAALAPEGRVRRPREAVLPAAALVAGLLTAIGVTFAFLAPSLPLGVDPSLDPAGPSHPRVVGNAGVLAVQLAGFALYSTAAIGFTLRAERNDDRLMAWVAVSTSFAAIASLNYFLFPSVYSEWVYVGDFFRLTFFIVLLVGAAWEIMHYQRSLERAAALEERRRLARELHDGLAQELAFIASQSRWLSRRGEPDETMEQLVVAAERALDESRSAISALTRPLDEPLDVAIAQAAEDVAGRVDIRLRLHLQGGIEVPVDTREALIRIVREAVSNTARHGKASVATVVLSADGGVTLRVDDDGIGFDPEDRDGRGFGLTSMSERARALGGELRVVSKPDSGTCIEVVIPWPTATRSR
jgi:signal transduction histidine kinase